MILVCSNLMVPSSILVDDAMLIMVATKGVLIIVDLLIRDLTMSSEPFLVISFARTFCMYGSGNGILDVQLTPGVRFISVRASGGCTIDDVSLMTPPGGRLVDFLLVSSDSLMFVTGGTRFQRFS